MSLIYSSKELKELLLAGAQQLAEIVGSSLGPKGRTVLLAKDRGNVVLVTKDGATIARELTLANPVANIACSVLKQAAAKTATMAGDGTTTATILADAIFSEAQVYFLTVPGISAVELQRGIELAVTTTIEELKKLARPIQCQADIQHVATIAANNDETIGKLISIAADKIGRDGSIVLEEAKSLQTTLDFVEGFRFEAQLLSSRFLTDNKRNMMVANDCYILVTDENIISVEMLLPILEQVAREKKPLLIVADGVEGEALAALIMNTVRGTLQVVAVKIPKYGEQRTAIMQDLAVASGGTFISCARSPNLSEIALVHLGKAKTVSYQNGFITCVGCQANNEQFKMLVDQLQKDLANVEEEAGVFLQERIIRLSSGVAIIKVGGNTEIEMRERKDRIEDALEAVRSAQEEGILPGGAIALINASKKLKDLQAPTAVQQFGVSIVQRALCAPFRKLAANATISDTVLLHELADKEPFQGYDFQQDRIVDMFEAGIVDPLKVVRCALQNAASVAGILLTSNYALLQEASADDRK
jgi:chaperonin GroEL